MGFKEDADFLRFLTMGAVGAVAVATNLRDQYGHRPIELERYAMSNKVWQTKVKRLRMPDLLCLHCGLRVESRAKSELRIILSHSDKEGREWFAGGMRDSDFYAFLHVDVTADPPTAGAPFYCTLAAMRATEEMAKTSVRKAVSEGSEVWLEWPSFVPTGDGVLEYPPDLMVMDHTGRSLVLRLDSGRKQTYWQWRKWPKRFLYVSDGTVVRGGETVIAGIVDPPQHLACPELAWDAALDLHSADEIDRFVAVKAAGYLARQDLSGAIEQVVSDTQTDWRLQLEGMAALARMGDLDQTSRLLEVVTADESSDDARMEAVFILSEIDEAAATAALTTIAGLPVPSEVRGAAVWGIGLGVRPIPSVAAAFIADPDDLVALHAASAVAEVDDSLAAVLVADLDREPRLAETAAALLLRHGRVRELLDQARGDGPGRLLALRALGDLPPEAFSAIGEHDIESEFGDVLRVLWRSRSDWIRRAGDDGLDALQAQRLRFGPII